MKKIPIRDHLVIGNYRPILLYELRYTYMFQNISISDKLTIMTRFLDIDNILYSIVYNNINNKYIAWRFEVDNAHIPKIEKFKYIQQKYI